MLFSSWRNITEKCIKSCFKKAGFSIPAEKECEEPENECEEPENECEEPENECEEPENECEEPENECEEPEKESENCENGINEEDWHTVSGGLATCTFNEFVDVDENLITSQLLEIGDIAAEIKGSEEDAA
ncbi:hypothetical protein AVEN_239602-1 [Araneus ventricosus]|uniref:Uncharacterized protein n=1 Tax=Araneus ventricosus TaxID=182803 RepID=A0A4Y2QVS2_ARAVE|nr:hypothetical protein AVEN_239602-1 [Araneus ventricosus]